VILISFYFDLRSGDLNFECCMVLFFVKQCLCTGSETDMLVSWTFELKLTFNWPCQSDIEDVGGQTLSIRNGPIIWVISIHTCFGMITLQTNDLVEDIVAEIGWITPYHVQFCCCNRISGCNCAEPDKATNMLSPVYWYSFNSFQLYLSSGSYPKITSQWC